ncbi:MAG: diguanylate cyclase [Planctomycetes bacterium]|nr:diguanylate cyclase [Planctomycetota bacterium]
MSRGTQTKILIIEDDPDQRMLIREAMCIHYGDDEGRNITAISSAKECLAPNLDEFDAALLDYHLPDMDGMALLEEILSRSDMPVIFVTGENSTGAAAEAIKHGAQDYVVKLGDYLFALPVLVDKNIDQHKMKEDNSRLRQELESALDEVRVKNIQLQEKNHQLEQLAATDPVTSLANRRRFAELLERYYGEAVRYGFDLTCCMLDLDHYKEFNDTFGHQVGDEILVTTAEIIRSSLRSSDVAARYGGDEFVLLLPHTSVARAESVAHRIREELVAAGDKYGRLENMLRLSGGIASLQANHPHSADTLLAMADKALYTAKDRGKDRVVLYGSSGRADVCAT